jgi:glutaredoxin
LGLSVDSVPSLLAWSESMGEITYPLLSDFFPHGQVAQKFGVLRADGTSERAIFVIDRTGIIRYVDVHDIDEQPDNEVLFGVLEELEPDAKKYQPEPEPEPEPAPAVREGVVLYCTRWCPTCYRARAYLEQRGIPYSEIDINYDKEAARRVREWANGNQTTPTFEIDGTVIVSYDEEKLNEVFARR